MPEISPEDLKKFEKTWSVEKEDWSKYSILEGTATVWARAILTKLFEIPKGHQGIPRDEWVTATQNVVTAFFPKTKPGKPTPMTPEELQGGVSVTYEPIDEPWNSYLIGGPKPMRIRVRLTATAIRYFPNRFNPTGDPTVAVDSQVVVGRAIPLAEHEKA